MYDYLIVGAGLFGSVFAQRVLEAGRRCLVIDKRDHIGGNVYSEKKDGIDVHIYGAHIFHTDNEEVWNYINRFSRFNNYINSPLASYKGKLYNLPFNMNTFNQLWNVNTPDQAKKKIEEQRRSYQHIIKPANLEEQALVLCGDDIYNAFVKEYTEKQWGKPATELPAFIIKRIPFRFTFDNNYFNDPYQGIPINGYDMLINNLLEGIEVKTNTNYLENRDFFDNVAHKIVFTGCIDEYFDYRLGHLEYRSLFFEHEYPDTDNYQGNAVVNYGEPSVSYTRIIEHKHFNFGIQPTTIITKEYPRAWFPGNEPYYPINDKKNAILYTDYNELARQYKKLIFGGRLGLFSYMDMDDTIAAALEFAMKELSTIQK